ncbi:enoyl-CoA hydratase/carnithine racemase [Thermosporothrix hazakensis]|uniref:Enoyl-CoA hydratase/carnithine racemase n=2 Tax=Thermosporothrix TaxID=768650 RepID=A0A326U7G3_THEHA|nr:enoyl-CoA hydratase/isomerase family protein [Thermosporothrix hazakensis]PZW26683.1 enoyl-CoA hydratase/carnithine racemase [Thermosporothrix hazakensis]
MAEIRTRVQKDVWWIILDNPPLNLLTTEMLVQCTAALQKALRLSPRLIVLSGIGEQAFCSGVDLPSEKQRSKLLHAARETDVMFSTVRQKKIPTVALIKGNAFGPGCEIASLCETIIAREDARFRLPAPNAQVFPSAVTTYLPSLIGQEQTTFLGQSGKTLSAREALHLGLAHQVLPARRFLQDTEELLIMLATIGSPA